MSRLNEITLGDIGRGLRRYQPFIAVVVAILLIVVLLPGDDDDSNEAAEVAAEGQGPVVGGQGSGGGSGGAGEADGGGGDTGPAAESDASTGAGGDLGGGGGGAASGGPEASAPGGAVPQVPAGVGADCDRATGRIRFPTRFAPPCTVFNGNNGGSTYQGVTAKEITVVWYQIQSSAATDAALTAAGANNSRPDQQATNRDYAAIYNTYFQLYGRKVKLIIKEGSGEADDDAVGKADAIDIATRIKPFVVYAGGPVNSFVEELAARKILCVCTVSQPQELYERLSPYVGYTTLMSSTQGYVHRAEYIGKRLHNRNAKWAGTSDGLPMSTAKRSFGLLYFETADKAYKSGVDFFERELKKYGVNLKVRLAYTGPPDLAATQEQSRPYIQRLKQAKVTSVVFSGDPISPAIFTKEATRQLYFPEWIVTGSALTDTTIFGRTYDTEQWRRAFGISFLTARIPDAQGDAYRIHVWHHGRPPTADNQYAVLNAPIFTTFLGIHMAGPNLTPQTFQRGLFSYPVTGRGFVTAQTTSWGKHGIWGMTDFTQYDDVTEVWWDPTAQGPDEVGNQAVGMYRYVDGGKRYLPGTHPRSEPKAFNPAGTVTIYANRPANERAPEYPRPKR